MHCCTSTRATALKLFRVAGGCIHMPYRNELAALGAREAALAKEVTAKQCELAEIRQSLDELRWKFRVRIARPCAADWNAMQGDDCIRHCARCRQNVYDLSAMTLAEGKALIREKEGNLCVRFYQRADGTVQTADCRSIRRIRKLVVAVGAAALLALALFGYSGFAAERAQKWSEEAYIKAHPFQGKYSGPRPR